MSSWPAEEEVSPINPAHYRGHPSGIECIQVTEHYDFCIGNAIKYLWRAGLKGGHDTERQDLEKAIWYIRRKLASLERSERPSLQELAESLPSPRDSALEPSYAPTSAEVSQEAGAPEERPLGVPENAVEARLSNGEKTWIWEINASVAIYDPNDSETPWYWHPHSKRQDEWTYGNPLLDVALWDACEALWKA